MIYKKTFLAECFTAVKSLLPGFQGMVGNKVLIRMQKEPFSKYSEILDIAKLDLVFSPESKEYIRSMPFTEIPALREEMLDYFREVGEEDYKNTLAKEAEDKKREKAYKRMEEVRARFTHAGDEETVKGSLAVMAEVDRLVPIVTPYENEYKKGLLFYDPSTRKVNTKINKDVFFMLKGIKPSEVISSGVAVVAHIAFNPFTTETRYVNNGSIFFNLYNPAPWRMIEFKGKAKIPSFIDRLLKHLFPDLEVREYVLSWLARALMDRNEIILCLIGARGTGKSLLARIQSALVGEDYSNIASSSILDDKFNSIMKDNRLLVLEEVAARTQTQINKLKAFANVFIPMEAKGEDQQTVQNYNSMMILANELNSLAISPQDRRFSVPEITDIDLRRVVDEAEISEFSAMLDNPEKIPHPEVVEFGNYLIQNYAYLTNKFSNYTAWKRDHYYQVARSNMSEWQLYLEEKLVNGEEEYYVLSELSKDFRRLNRELKFPVTSSTINNFLTDYLYMGKVKLGTLEQGIDPDMPESTRFIVPNPELYKHVVRKSEDIL